MTKHQLAEMLNGREIGEEILDAESKIAAGVGLVVMFGYSDDNIEIRGAFTEEIGAFNGTTIFMHSGGILDDPDSNGCEKCKQRLIEERKKCAPIACEWNTDGYSWVIITPVSIPFEPFDIMEDGEKFCRGVVFEAKHLPKI